MEHPDLYRELSCKILDRCIQLFGPAYADECSQARADYDEIDPAHPGALHLYIHSVEASPNPSRGIDAANRLFAAGCGIQLVALLAEPVGHRMEHLTVVVDKK